MCGSLSGGTPGPPAPPQPARAPRGPRGAPPPPGAPPPAPPPPPANPPPPSAPSTRPGTTGPRAPPPGRATPPRTPRPPAEGGRARRRGGAPRSHWGDGGGGPGAPPDKLPHIFERFYRAGSQGTRGSGLGLAIAAEIAAAHGGTAEAARVFPRGLRIRLALPVGPPPDPGRPARDQLAMSTS